MVGTVLDPGQIKVYKVPCSHERTGGGGQINKCIYQIDIISGGENCYGEE